MGLAINLIVILLFILGAAAFAMTDAGREKLKKLNELFNKFQSLFYSSGESGSTQSLVSQLFYKYNHEKLEEWLHWISKQDEATRQEAFRLLKEHLEGKSKHWGNVTEEVLLALKDFDDLAIFPTLSSFYTRLRNCWPEYRIIPKLFAQTAKICYDIEEEASLELFETEFSGERVADPDFDDRAKIILDTVTEKAKTGLDFLVKVVAKEIVPIETRRYALAKFKKLPEDSKHVFIEKILDPYIKDPVRLDKKPKETDISFENKCDFFRSIIDMTLDFLDYPKIFHTISQFCKSKKDFKRIVVQSILADINNGSNLRALKLFTYYHLPDDENFTFRKALSKRQGLREDINRKLIFKKRLMDLNFEKLSSKASFFTDLPIPDSLEKDYKSFKNKISNSKTPLFSSNQNGVLLTGKNKYEKVYFARSLTLEKEGNFSYYDISQVKDVQTIEKMKSALTGKAGWDMPLLLFLDRVETFFENKPELKEPMVELFEAYCNFAVRGEIAIVGATKYPQEHIASNKLLKDKLDYMTDKLFMLKWDTSLDPEFRQNVLDEYIAMTDDRDNENEEDFIDIMKRASEDMSDIEFCSFLEDELVLQLICFGKIKSLGMIDEFRKKVLS